jgi:hypothetical protein
LLPCSRRQAIRAKNVLIDEGCSIDEAEKRSP